MAKSTEYYALCEELKILDVYAQTKGLNARCQASSNISVTFRFASVGSPNNQLLIGRLHYRWPQLNFYFVIFLIECRATFPNNERTYLKNVLTAIHRRAG